MAALYVILIILAVIMIIIYIPVDCVIDISYNNTENRGSITLRYAFLKITIFPAEKKIEKAAEETEKEAEKEIPPKDKKDIAGIISFSKTVYGELRADIINILKQFFKRTLRIKELNISSKFGLGNPMYTGIAYGNVCSAVYGTVSFVDRHMTLDKWNVSLDADFDNACLSAGLYCKIRTRIAFALKLGVMAAILLLRIQIINRRIKKNG